jgi:phage gp36-like protein
MAEYATVNDVKAKFLKIDFSESTKPTLKVVKDLLKTQTEIINARICSRYQLPIEKLTYPSAYAVLNRICLWLMVYEIEDIINLSRTVPKGEKVEKSRGERAYDKAMTELGKIESGVVTLDVVELSTGERIYSSNVGNRCAQPTFIKGKVQW